MGLLDQVLGSLMGGSGNSSPMQNVLMSLLAGQQGGSQATNQNPGTQGSPGTAGGGMVGGGMTGAGMAGGLASLVSGFQQAGLGNIVQSWISNGPNQPVSPQQLQNALGDQQVQSMANQAGVPQHDFLSQLSQHLPNAVNGMTPNGKLPDEGSMSV